MVSQVPGSCGCAGGGCGCARPPQRTGRPAASFQQGAFRPYPADGHAPNQRNPPPRPPPPREPPPPRPPPHGQVPEKPRPYRTPFCDKHPNDPRCNPSVKTPPPPDLRLDTDLLPDILVSASEFRALVQVRTCDWAPDPERPDAPDIHPLIDGDFLSFNMFTSNIGDGPLVIAYDAQYSEPINGVGGGSYQRGSNPRQLIYQRGANGHPIPEDGGRIGRFVPLPAHRFDIGINAGYIMLFDFASFGLYLRQGDKLLGHSAIRERVEGRVRGSKKPGGRGVVFRPAAVLPVVPIVTRRKKYFCFRDSGPNVDFIGVPAQRRFGMGRPPSVECTPQEGLDGPLYRMGVSVGWYDLYEPNANASRGVCDQYLDIEGLPDGVYLFRLTINYPSANGDRLILEKDYSNNMFETSVRLSTQDGRRRVERIR